VVRELMEEQHKEMLRNLINGVYDNIDVLGLTTSYQPGQLASDHQVSQMRLQKGQAMAVPMPAPAPVTTLPPEVIEARSLKVQPQINEVGAETLFGEDLISEKSLDEVILSYLAGEGEQ
jgi:hypothetical protein